MILQARRIARLPAPCRPKTTLRFVALLRTPSVYDTHLGYTSQLVHDPGCNHTTGVLKGADLRDITESSLFREALQGNNNWAKIISKLL